MSAFFGFALLQLTTPAVADDWWKYLISPVVCAFIGWLTNWVAIKMLFHPRDPINLGICKIQGVFPKRQLALAENLGHMIEKNLFNHTDIQKVLGDPGFHTVFRTVAEEKINDFLDKKIGEINPMIAMFLSAELKTRVREMLLAEMDGMLPQLLEKASAELENRLVIRELIRDKVAGFSSAKVEELLVAVMKSEFRFIEIVGGVLGFLIGVAQTLFFALV